VGEGGVEGVGRGVGLFPSYGIDDLEHHRLQGETEAEDDVVRARDPDGAIRLQDATSLLQPPDVEPVITREPHGPVPGTLVHSSEHAALDRNSARGEPVRRVGEDHVHAVWGYKLHEIHTVSEVDHSPRLAERLQVP